MSITKKTTMAGHSRESKTAPQYEGTLCTRFYGCNKEGHCKPRCSSNAMKCYKKPEKQEF